MSAYIYIEFIIYYSPGAPTKEEAVYTKKIPDKFCRYNYALEHRIPRSSAHAFCSCYSCNYNNNNNINNKTQIIPLKVEFRYFLRYQSNSKHKTQISIALANYAINNENDGGKIRMQNILTSQDIFYMCVCY